MDSNNKSQKNRIMYHVGLAVACLAILTLILFGVVTLIKNAKNDKELEKMRESMGSETNHPVANVSRSPFDAVYPGIGGNQEGLTPTATPLPTDTPSPTPTPRPIVIQDSMQGLHVYNEDIAGWLYMRETRDPEIDYPVMQTFDDPSTPDNEGEYYIYRGLDGKELKRGSLFLDQNSRSGVGYKEDKYVGGSKPSDIMMIYGHNMGDGTMFGYLFEFLHTDYAKEHKYIEYDTLYEHRRYEVISVFRSHVFTSADLMDYSNYYDPNFKYYQFTGDLTESTFNYWYANVVSHNELDFEEYNAKYGDEFLVLSTCSTTDETGARNKNGRLCLVAVRIE